MIQTHTIIRRKGTRAAALLAGFVLALSISLEAQAASSWKPTLLVNTESFQTIDEGDSTTNIELKFGDTLKESLFYNRTAARFQFTRSLYIQGDLTATGSTSIKQVMSGTHLRVDKNADIWGNLAVSGTTLVDGNIYGSGSLFIESNANITGNELVGGNIAGSGTLSIEGASSLQGAITAGSTLDTVGSITTDADLTINQDNGAADAVLTFGNDAGAETLKFNNTTNQFELSDDLAVTGALSASGVLSVDGTAYLNSSEVVTGTSTTSGNIYGSGSLFIESNANITGNELVGGNIAGSGTLSIEGAASFGSTVKLNGVVYTFPYGDGAASGKVLKTDGAGQLVWATDAGSVNGLNYDDGDKRYVNISGDTMTGALNVRGHLSGSALTVDGTADIFGNLGVSGATLVDGNIYGSGSLFIESNANITGNELVGGNLAASGTLSIEGASSLQGAITAGSTLDTVGTITTDADLTINHDNGAADAVLTFGNDAGAETLKFNNTTNQFELSDDLAVTGALSASGVLSVDGTAYINGAAVFGSTLQLNGVTYTFPYGDGAASGRVLKTDGAGNLSWATDIDTNTNAQTLCAADEYLDGDGNCVDVIEEAELNTFAELQTQITDATLLDLTASDNRYVNRSGDTMTGALQVRANISGSSLRVDGNADIWGTLGVSGAIKLNGQSYTFPTTNGDASQVLTTDGDGTLSWSSKGIGIGSGGVFSISPEYPDAVYTASGSAYIGQLTYDYDATNKENYYRWTSSKAALQDYWIVIRVRVPDNYSAWDNVRPIQFRYRTTSADTDVNSVSIRMLDTAGNAVALTGGEKIAATDWTTATVTGSEAAGTYTPGSFITVFVKVVTTVAGSADAGFINLNWETTAP
ncbi:TPA: hypothetical protein DCL30_03435 [Candidatus Peribacteria bacterium]|nr:MAG: hypothetical protein A2529_05220 [Candidatus Peribacteria bacterium RIFOXYD2_FULL_58_15]HAI98562.1 hypothetical protein [Candidatus Peribacteria bacterium]HAS34275.1 hypothetical protein [Candidatus Peribacteria bacterium]